MQVRVPSLAPPNHREDDLVIDRIRHDIQQRLEQLLAEADKLRGALAALDPRERPAPTATRATARRAAAPAAATPAVAEPAAAGPAAPRPARARKASRPAAGAATNGATTRTPPGQTREQVVAALSSSQALTAGEVAKATGLARPTVSTTLSKLAKTGEIVKADRGYRLRG
jgi:DNA-binding transcriptional ArsR family regulator